MYLFQKAPTDFALGMKREGLALVQNLGIVVERQGSEFSTQGSEYIFPKS